MDSTTPAQQMNIKRGGIIIYILQTSLLRCKLHSMSLCPGVNLGCILFFLSPCLLSQGEYLALLSVLFGITCILSTSQLFHFVVNQRHNNVYQPHPHLDGAY